MTPAERTDERGVITMVDGVEFVSRAAYRDVLRQRDRLRDDLDKFADWLERDRREPDKVLCVVQSMRRAAF